MSIRGLIGVSTGVHCCSAIQGCRVQDFAVQFWVLSVERSRLGGGRTRSSEPIQSSLPQSRLSLPAVSNPHYAPSLHPKHLFLNQATSES